MPDLIDPATELMAVLRALSPRDRFLIADSISDTHHMVDDDMGEDAEARRSAYQALGKFVRGCHQ